MPARKKFFVPQADITLWELAQLMALLGIDYSPGIYITDAWWETLGVMQRHFADEAPVEWKNKNAS